MHGPDRVDDTSTDHHHFETRQVARDRDGRRPSTADLDERAVREVVQSLLADETVTAVPEQRLYVHWLGGRRSRSRLELTACHRGWSAVRDLEAAAH